MGSELRRGALAIGCALGLAWSLASGAARAEPTPQEKELARELMQKGRTARDAHDLQGALKSFRAADDIMHVPTTGFEVARSLVDIGQLVEAHEALLRVMRIPERADDSAAFKDARGYAKVLDEELATRIPQLRIHVEGSSSPANVTVDGVALPADALVVPYKVDPGHHVVTARAENAEGKTEIDVREKETRDVGVTLVPVAAPQLPAAAVTANPPPPVSDHPGAPASASRVGPITWVGFGVAAAGLVAGSVTGLMAMSDKSTLDGQCHTGHCGPSTYDTLDSANTLATISTISFIVAGVGAGVGVASLFLGRPREAAPASATVEPWIGVGAVGARGSF